MDPLTLKFYAYPNCNSCRNAKRWLDEQAIDYEYIHIVEQTPTKEEILTLINLSDLKPRRFFNTSGRVYRELKMKDKINDLSTEEMATYLASDGMLIRRPIITDGKQVTVGYNEEELTQYWL